MIGGAACPPSMLRAFEEEHGMTVRHLWGMTETSPIGTIGGFKVWTYGPLFFRIYSPQAPVTFFLVDKELPAYYLWRL